MKSTTRAVPQIALCILAVLVVVCRANWRKIFYRKSSRHLARFRRFVCSKIKAMHLCASRQRKLPLMPSLPCIIRKLISKLWNVHGEKNRVIQIMFRPLPRVKLYRQLAFHLATASKSLAIGIRLPRQQPPTPQRQLPPLTCKVNGKECRAMHTDNSRDINKLAIWGKVYYLSIIVIAIIIIMWFSLCSLEWEHQCQFREQLGSHQLHN